MRLFVFGLGYSAAAAMDLLLEGAEAVAGTSRTPGNRPRMAAGDVRMLAFDGISPGAGVAAALAGATHILVSVPPGETGDPVLAHHAADILSSGAGWIGYLSTVGVYGNYGGAWVSERTTPHPASQRSRNRLAAEAAWSALAEAGGRRLAILRIAGIYGPGRNAFVNLAAGTAKRIVKPGQVFNRIHVADIAAAVAAAARQEATGIFNLADDEPAPPQDVVAHAAGLMGVPPPPEVPLEEADLSPMARSFYGDNKRVANRRLKADLGVRLAFPTYREGLAALWRDGAWR